MPAAPLYGFGGHRAVRYPLAFVELPRVPQVKGRHLRRRRNNDGVHQHELPSDWLTARSSVLSSSTGVGDLHRSKQNSLHCWRSSSQAAAPLGW